MKKIIKDLQMKVSTFDENKPTKATNDDGLPCEPYDELDILDDGATRPANEGQLVMAMNEIETSQAETDRLSFYRYEYAD